LNIIIDGQDDLVSLAEGASLEGLAESLEGTLLSSGRKSLSYHLDGRECPLDQLADALSAGGTTLEIKTRPLSDFIQGILSDMESGIKDSQEKMIELGEALTQPNPSEALDQLRGWNQELLSMCQGLGQLMHMLSMDQDELRSENGLSLREILYRLEKLCEDFTSQLKSNDLGAVADLCECDAVELLQAVGKLIPQLKQNVVEAFPAY
jgi:hypothetical protein